MVCLSKAGGSRAVRSQKPAMKCSHVYRLSCIFQARRLLGPDFATFFKKFAPDKGFANKVRQFVGAQGPFGVYTIA